FPGSNWCTGTAAAHSAGAPLRAICETYSNGTGQGGHFWNFTNDPHMTDATNTYFVTRAAAAAHGYVREPAPHAGFWESFDLTNSHDPIIAADVQQSVPNMILLNSGITFAGF